MASRIGFGWTVILLGGCVGCERTAEVAHYQVPSENVARSVAAPPETTPDNAPIHKRMLSAIVPVDGQVWFFKVVGPVDQVSAKSADVDQLLQSVRFESPERPQWTLPEGWTEHAGNQFRHATLKSGDLELTVSRLPAPGGTATAPYILDNVNRWRGELQLAHVPLEELEQTAKPEEIAGRPAYRIDLTGIAAPAGAMRGPFQQAAGSGATGAGAAPSAVPASPTTDVSPRSTVAGAASESGERRVGGLVFTKPEHWRDGPGGALRLAAFVVEQDGRSAEITLIALGPRAGSTLDNVNRWRKEIDLPAMDQAQLETVMSSIEIDGVASQYARLSEPSAKTSQAILAVIIPRSDRTLFIKIKGPDDLVVAEEAAFTEFVRSIRFAS